MTLCECGCGLPAPIAKTTRTSLGHVKGQPIRFISGHNRPQPRPEQRSRGRGSHGGKGWYIDPQGYRRVYQPDHPRADHRGYVKEHRLVVEQGLGRFLEKAEHVHHANRERSSNAAANLEVKTPTEHAHEHEFWKAKKPPTDKYKAARREQLITLWEKRHRGESPMPVRRAPGTPRTPEQRQAISAAQLARHAREREERALLALADFAGDDHFSP